MDELLAQFLVEARELVTLAVSNIEALRRDSEDRKHLDSAFRAFHTLKGSVALFEMAPAGKVLHAAEGLLEQARKNSLKLDDQRLSALLACLDRIDVWVDAMESHGALPGNASGEAQTLVERLGRQQSAPVQRKQEDSDWIAALLARDFDSALIEAGGLTAFRYEPNDQCFFRGDDPLAIVSAVPKLAAVKVMPRGEWPPLADIQPFYCVLVIEGLSHAGADEVEAAFRLVSDQVKIAEVTLERGLQAERIASPAPYDHCVSMPGASTRSQTGLAN